MTAEAAMANANAKRDGPDRIVTPVPRDISAHRATHVSKIVSPVPLPSLVRNATVTITFTKKIVCHRAQAVFSKILILTILSMCAQPAKPIVKTA